MAGCSKKQYAIMMSAGPDGKKLASEMGGMEQDEFNDAFSQLMGKGGSEYNRDDDEDYKDFDPDSEDDYGFDEEDDFETDFNEMKASGIDVENPQEVMEYLGANMGLDRESQVRFMERMGYTVDDIERFRNPDDDDDDNHLSYEEVFTDNDNKQIERYAKHYGVDASELKDTIHQTALDYIREGASITNAKNDAMEEILENEEYDREMIKAQEQNAAMSENEPDDFDLDKNNNKYTKDDLGYKRNNKGGFDVIQKDTDERDEKVLSSFNSKEEAKSYIKKLLDKNEFNEPDRRYLEDKDIGPGPDYPDISDEEQAEIDKGLSDARKVVDKEVSDFLKGRRIKESDFKQIQNEMEQKLGHAPDSIALFRYMRDNPGQFENKPVKYGKDSQNRFYVDDANGYRQYFAKEEEARDYAERINAASGNEPADKYLAPEEIGIDYDNPQASVRYYEKKNNVKLIYNPDTGKYKVVPNENDNADEARKVPHVQIREGMNPKNKEIAEYINNLSEDETYWLFDALRSKFGK